MKKWRQFSSIFAAQNPVFMHFSFWHFALKMALSVAVLAVFAQISFPIGAVSATGQSFAVMLVGCVLGKKWGPLAVLFYLVLGAAGLPFFAGGTGGWAVFSKPSAGFLLAFLSTAWLAGWLTERGWARSFGGCLGLFGVATMGLLFLGDVWLLRFFDIEKTMQVGLLNLLPGAAVKMLAGAAVLRFFDQKGWTN